MSSLIKSIVEYDDLEEDDLDLNRACDEDDEKGFDRTVGHLCDVCRKEQAKYTCPRCSLRYCSLQCYKHESHVACLESFYRDSVCEQMHHNRVRDADRKNVLDILERFERDDDNAMVQEHGLMRDDGLNGSDDSVEADEDGGTNDILERFNGIDLDTASVHQIWSRMTPHERDTFERTIASGRPQDIAKIAKGIEPWEPWWERERERTGPSIVEIEQGKDLGQKEMEREGATDTNRCVPVVLADLQPLEKLTRVTPNPAIVFDIVNVLLAYAHACRYYNGDIHETPEETCRTVWETCPVLTGEARAPCEDVAAAIAIGLQAVSKKHAIFRRQCAIFVRDVANILSTPENVLAALSDLHRVFDANKKKRLTASTKEEQQEQDLARRSFLAAKKLYFQLAYVQNLKARDGAETLGVLRLAVNQEWRDLEREGRQFESARGRVERDIIPNSRSGSKRLITELD